MHRVNEATSIGRKILADFAVDLRMYHRTQTQNRIYVSSNRHRENPEIAPKVKCLAARSRAEPSGGALLGNEHRALDEGRVSLLKKM